jgi:hypothetical protein
MKLFEGATGAEGKRGAFKNGRKAEEIEEFYFEGREEGWGEGRYGEFV